MRVTKFGHSCLLIEEESARILIDPGAFSTGQNDAKNIDAVLITHEHQDHYTSESVKAILQNNPTATVITQSAVGKLLTEADIPFTEVGDGQSAEVKGIKIEGFGIDHALIHSSVPRFKNTGYMIAGRLYHPGDSLYVPPKAVEILALPVAAPWLKIGEVIDYALEVKPKVCFPIHDGILRPERTGFIGAYIAKLLEPAKIEFRNMADGAVEEF